MLQRYILRELLRGFLLSLAGFTTLFLVMQGYSVLRSIPGSGSALIGELVWPMTIGVLPFALLVATVLGTTICYGRLAGDRELDAMRVSGLPLRSILMPALALGLLASAGSFWLNWKAAPEAGRKRRALSRKAVLEVLRDPPPGPREIRIGRRTLTYRRVESGRLLGVRLVVPPQGGEGVEEQIEAESARVRVPGDGDARLEMERCRVLRFHRGGRRSEELTFERRSIPLPMPEAPEAVRPKYVSGAELDRFEGHPYWARAARIEFHGRIARSAAPLLLGFLAALIGIQVRRSSLLAGLGASLPPLLLYFLLTIPLEGLAERGTLAPSPAAYLPIGALALVDGWLYGKAAR